MHLMEGGFRKAADSVFSPDSAGVHFLYIIIMFFPVPLRSWAATALMTRGVG